MLQNCLKIDVNWPTFEPRKVNAEFSARDSYITHVAYGVQRRFFLKASKHMPEFVAVLEI